MWSYILGLMPNYQLIYLVSVLSFCLFTEFYSKVHDSYTTNF